MMSNVEFAKMVAENAMNRISKSDCEYMADSELVAALEKWEVAEESKDNVLREMAYRAHRYGYCADRFAKYIA